MQEKTTKKINKNKGQVYTWDMIFSTMLFLTVLYISIFLWNSSIDHSRTGEIEYKMGWHSENIVDQLLKSPGVPPQWSPKTIQVYGLADTSNQTRKWMGTGHQSKIIDADKLLYLIHAANNNYTEMRKKLIGSSRYDIGFRLSCENQTRIDCLHAVPVETLGVNVECTNGYNFSITNGKLDSHIWIEAEDEQYFKNETDLYCGTGSEYCSGKNNSEISTNHPPINTILDPGYYNIWVRSYDDDSETAIIIENQSFKISQEENLGMRWNLVGAKYLEGEIEIKIDNPTTYYLDAILLTTKADLSPNNQKEEEFGNPNQIKECYFGKQTQLGEKVIAYSNTAVFSRPLSDQILLGGNIIELPKTFRLDAYLIYNPEDEDTGDSTTTVGAAAIPLICTTLDPTDNPDCDYGNPSIIDFQNIDMPEELECGQTYDIDFSFIGKHNLNRNYYAFHAINSTGHNVKLGSCRTLYDADNNEHLHTTTCEITMPNPSQELGDGIHTIILTGEDSDGYCLPNDPEADDQETFQVELKNCRNWNLLNCNQDTASIKECGNPQDQIDIINAEAPWGADCGEEFNVTITWNGSHIQDATVKNYWGFFLDDNFANPIGICSSSNIDTGNNYYKMNCTLSVNLPEQGWHELKITAEDAQGVCNDTNRADSWISAGDMAFSNCP